MGCLICPLEYARSEDIIFRPLFNSPKEQVRIKFAYPTDSLVDN